MANGSPTRTGDRAKASAESGLLANQLQVHKLKCENSYINDMGAAHSKLPLCEPTGSRNLLKLNVG